MKKILFNDVYGLTQSVLEARKTMTRRIVPDNTPLGSWEKTVKKSRYQVGEVLAVAQSYKNIKGFNRENCGAGWSNKMFVSASLMPHKIRITDIKVERLQDISEEDCLKEGIQEYFPYIDRNPNDKVRTFQYFKEGKIRHRISPASKCFAYLIDDICGKGTWEKNPYVFAYTFELVK